MQGRYDEAYLVRGGWLAAFEQWTGGASLLDRQVLQASRALASRKLEAARRSNRRLRTLASGPAILLVIALAADGMAIQRNRHREGKASNTSRGVESDAVSDAP